MAIHLQEEWVHTSRKRDFSVKIHSSCIHNSQEVKPIQIFLNKNVGKQIMVFDTIQQEKGMHMQDG